VGGRGIDDAGIGIVDQRHRLFRGVIRQAKEGHIGFVDQALALGNILALVGVDFQQRDVGALGEVFIDLQAGRTFLAVDKDFIGHGVSTVSDVV
jgi:hypothetical protein